MWLSWATAVVVVGTAVAARILAQTSTDVQALGGPLQLVFRVTVAQRAPDCFQREVFLVNGTFQPEVVVTQGQTLQVRDCQGQAYTRKVPSRCAAYVLCLLTCMHERSRTSPLRMRLVRQAAGVACKRVRTTKHV